MRTVPGVGDYMRPVEVGEYVSPVEEVLDNNFLPELLGLQSISVKLRKLLALGSKSSGLGIRDPKEAVDKNHQTLQACNEQLVEYLLTGEALSTVKHRACVQRGSSDGMKIKK